MKKIVDTPLLAIFVAGFLLRLVYVTCFNNTLHWPDEHRFWAEIQNVLNQQTFRWGKIFAHDMPLTALLLAIPVSLFGLLGAKIFLALVSAATILLVAALADTVYPGKKTGLIAGLFCAFYPHFIYYSGLLLSETLFLFFTTAFFVALYRHETTKDACTFGFCAGAAHLTRPTLLYFFPISLLYYLFTSRFNYKKVAVAAGVALLLVVPWALRNYHHFGTLIFTNVGSGQVLWEGNNPWNKDGGVSEKSWGYLENMPKGLSELETDNWKKEQAISYIKENPGIFVRNGLKKFLRFWHLWPNALQFDKTIYKVISLLSFLPILLLALASMAVLWRRWQIIAILWIFIAYYTAIHMVTIGSIRYRLPLEPLLIALAAATLAKLLDWWSKKTEVNETARF